MRSGTPSVQSSRSAQSVRPKRGSSGNDTACLRATYRSSDLIARGAAHDEQQKETAIEGNRRRRQTFSSKLRTERTVAVSSAMRTTL